MDAQSSLSSRSPCSRSLLSALAGGLLRQRQRRWPGRTKFRSSTASSPRPWRPSNANTSTKCRRIGWSYGAIDGMLQTLDPHSSFFDPREYAQMRERQEGRYYGLGIRSQSIDGDITVMSIFEGSPAYKKGLRRGDVIAKIGEAGREGLDERAGGQEAEGAEGHDGQHLDQAPRLRRPDRHGRRARRGEHHHRPRRVHDRQGDRLRQAGSVHRDVRPRARRRAAEAERQRHEAAGVRPARQPRRRARSGDPRSRTASCRAAT